MAPPKLNRKLACWDKKNPLTPSARELAAIESFRSAAVPPGVTLNEAFDQDDQ